MAPKFACPSCSDYSIVEGMRIRPLENPAEPDGLPFTSPLYKDSCWPKGCVACGAPPNRLEEVSGETVQASSLVVGRLVVAKGKAPGVPYCSAHKDALEVRSTQGSGAGAALVLSEDDAPLPGRQSKRLERRASTSGGGSKWKTRKTPGGLNGQSLRRSKG